MCRCPGLGSRHRLQVAKLLYESGRQLTGSPMLFELVTMLPDTMTAASRSSVQTAVLPRSEQPTQAVSRPTDQQVQLQDRDAQHRQRSSKHEHSRRVMNVGQESALLQVGPCHFGVVQIPGASRPELPALFYGLLASLKTAWPTQLACWCRRGGSRGRPAAHRLACGPSGRGFRPMSGAQLSCSPCSRAGWWSSGAPPAVESPPRCPSTSWKRC